MSESTADERVMEAGRGMDRLIFERVMGFDPSWWTDDWHGHYVQTTRSGRVHLARSPEYSTRMSAAWEVVEAVQTQHPGWRFSLTGGDTSFATVYPSTGGIRVDRERRVAFGWHAEFFGHEDPEIDTGQRHGEAYARTPMAAICLAALAIRP